MKTLNEEIEAVRGKICGLKNEFWDDQDHAVGGYISRKEINDILSTLK